MRIGQLAAATGERVRTLRFWQDAGLLEAQRTRSGYRVFSLESVERVHLLRGAQALGFTLSEIREVERVRAGGNQPCDAVRARLQEHLVDVRERRRRLEALEERLERHVAWADEHPKVACAVGCVYLSRTAAGPSEDAG